MPIGSNQAISSAIVVVVSLISLSSPPMIPPMPIGRVVGVADQQVVGGERALDSVERDHRLAFGREADAEAPAAERVEVVGVVRLVELEHHVVADVDDVVDRAHAGCREAAGDPVGRRGDVHAADARCW